MPQFILDHGTPEASRTFASLDSFTQGYIEALFFTECAPNAPDAETFHAQCESGVNEGSIPNDATFADLAPDALAAIVADCEAFQAANRADLGEALDNGRINGYDESRAGNDYWYTRNGHGTGFWDRGLGDAGDKLAAACRYREVHIYFGDDNLIHI